MNQLDLFSVSPAEPTVAQHEAEQRAIEARNAREGERRKREGMERATWGKERLLAHAREIACDVARGVLPRANGRCSDSGIVTADDVAAQWDRENEERKAKGWPTVDWVGNAAGHIFKDGNWEWTGQLVESSRPHAHKNLLREWRRKHG
jgi:hypothetical protein